jgi:hypothetical protein
MEEEEGNQGICSSSGMVGLVRNPFDARFLVAAVNACKGLSAEDLEDGITEELHDSARLRQLALLAHQKADEIDMENNKPRIGRVELQIGYAIDLDDLSKVEEAKEKIIDDLIDLVSKGGEEAIRTFIVEKHDPSLTEEEVCEELISEYEEDDLETNIDALNGEQTRGCS